MGTTTSPAPGQRARARRPRCGDAPAQRRRPPAAPLSLPALLGLALLAAGPRRAAAADADSWRGRVIYLVVVDRFSRSPNATSPSCPNLQGWCGGTLAGAAARLEYVSGLGADAVWLTPVVKQCPGTVDGATAYHGYWAQDFYKVDPHFGTAADLRALSDRAHALGMYVMLDVVPNHVGPCPLKDIVPFNRSDHYHDCAGCDEQCSIPASSTDDPSNEKVIEHCRFSELPDLDQDQPFVRQQLLAWVRELVRSYTIDGLRVDTTPMMKREFLKEFSKAAGVFTIGEVPFAGDDNLNTVPFVVSFSGGRALDSALSFPMFGALTAVFAHGEDMTTLQSVRCLYQEAFSPAELGLLGTFVENHDNPRFLALQPDRQRYKNALAWVLTAEGIPVLYYGGEQGVAGTTGAGRMGDGGLRQPLWEAGFDRSAPLYTWIQRLTRYRKQARLWEWPQVDVHASKRCYALARGPVLVVLTNAGAGSKVACEFEIPEGLQSISKSGVLRNVLDPQAPSVRSYAATRAVRLQLQNGEPLILEMQGSPGRDAAALAERPEAGAPGGARPGSAGGRRRALSATAAAAAAAAVAVLAPAALG